MKRGLEDMERRKIKKSERQNVVGFRCRPRVWLRVSVVQETNTEQSESLIQITSKMSYLNCIRVITALGLHSDMQTS